MYCIWRRIRRVDVLNVFQFRLGKSRKKENTHIKLGEINIMNIINDNTLNLLISLFNKDNRYMKVTQKFKQIGVAR